MEQEKGTYGFKELHTEANKLFPPHLNHVTYIGPVAARETGSRGRGLFTTKGAKTGDLLLCEEVFVHAFVDVESEKESASMWFILNMETERMTMGAQVDLLGLIVRKLHEPSQSFIMVHTSLLMLLKSDGKLLVDM